MADKTLFLVCNSHIDPVWLWPWEEGLAATLATFRAAAELCEEFDGFVFCHNEALLYAWVEEYEPALFARIRQLVRDGRWHVMGGWYLQPDCNLPCGESFVRQILVGKRYFSRSSASSRASPSTSIRSATPAASCRSWRSPATTATSSAAPIAAARRCPSDDFVWVGYDGSTVLAHRASEHYNSELGTGAPPRSSAGSRHNGDRPRGHAALGRRQPRRRPVARGPAGAGRD